MGHDFIERELTSRIIGAFYEVYNQLGFGHLEANLCRALERVLSREGIRIEREYPATVYFEGTPIGFHRVDMLVERRVIVEVKSTEILSPFARRQLRNYLCALQLEVGLILHFGPKPKVYRMIGNLGQHPAVSRSRPG